MYIYLYKISHSTSTHPPFPLMTVRYGTRLATVAIVYDDDSDHINETPPVFKNDICPNNSVQCDGIKNCQLGTDEANCSK